jgi:Holliday junction resolvasome RuvABC endonuclease subunit
METTMTDWSWKPRVLGVDPSLTGTGICRVSDYVEELATVRTTLNGHARMDAIVDEVMIRATIWGVRVDMVVIEGPSYGSASQSHPGHHERAGLWWLITHALHSAKIPYAVVSPKGRAKYGCGNGNGDKSAVKAAVRETYGHLVKIGNDNAADALILAAMGLDHMGGTLGVRVPAVNRMALDAVQWPDLMSDE